ncbi:MULTISPECIES: transporter [Aequorivita]|uniref:Transporter n=1 Tax=Aequorivita iocasae TaxID=2803865 RepID=A0ABX7DSA9_9FLAO|nr:MULTISPECIES: transporter [Aequorivita]QQX76352.1 transporter [Aequorivita iocasae]UCA55818.1 transporter [Aequorivita sp. F7]
MNIKLPSLFLLCTISFSTVSAQYTEMINTNRPGGSQGAFSVGTNVLQVETGFSYGKEKHDLLKTETNGFNIDYSVRYGFWKERLEVSLMGEFQSNSVTDNRSSSTREYSLSNFKSNTLGAKYLIYDPYRKRDLKGPNLYSWKANNKTQWADLIPAISIYAGANFDFADNPFTPEAESSISPKLVLSTQNNFIGGWVFVTNIIVDRVTTDFPTYGYIITLTHATNRYFSVFLENQGLKSDFYADQLIRGGAAALINQNLQVDLSLTYSFKDTPSKFYGRAGLAYRFDMHNKDEYLEDDANKEMKDKKEKDKKEERQEELNLDEGGE